MSSEEWFLCAKCGELRSHFQAPRPGAATNEAPVWWCSICGTRYRTPRQRKPIRTGKLSQ
jgi:hypothetical protein